MTRPALRIATTAMSLYVVETVFHLASVVDADALNFLAREPKIFSRLPPARLLTPHPGEMSRLVPGSGSGNRSELARSFADRTGITLLLKGARTIVASPGRPLEFNTTGHPGMASGGMGDVLTLIERAQEQLDQEEAEKAGKKMLQGDFNL